MEITVFKCYFPKCMIMSNYSPDWLLHYCRNQTLYSTTVSYTQWWAQTFYF